MTSTSGFTRHTTILTPALLLLLAGPATAQLSSPPPDAGAPAFGLAPPDAGTTDGSADVRADADIDATDAETGSDAPPAADAIPAPEAGPAEPAVTLEPGADTRTGIRGRVVDRGSGRGLYPAPVVIRAADGRARTVMTDDRGAYRAYVPPGTYVVRSYYDLYHGARIANVRVNRGDFTNVNLVLDAISLVEDVAIQEIEIPYRADTTTAAAQDQLRKESSGIGEGMGAQQMSQQGASDAASAARRVVGVTVDKNQLVVRGLGGRYVKVFLNGMPIPNTDPDFPSVDLDLFPTDVIDSFTISKTFLPELTADFAGGVLDITTVSFPREFTLNAGLSLGVNSETTFRDVLTYQGGDHDYLGFDDGSRALPKSAEGRKLTLLRRGTGIPRDELNDITRDFNNVWSYERTTGLPKIGVDFSIGDSFKLANRKRVGYLAALVYDYSNSRQVGVARPRPGIDDATGKLTVINEYETETGSEEVQLAAIGTASLDVGLDHSFTVVTMFNRSLDDETKWQYGKQGEISNEKDEFARKWQLRFLTRTLWLNQFLADHRNLLGTRLRLRWSGFFSSGRRDEPDQRTITYATASGVNNRWRPPASRLFSELEQTDYGANASLRFPLWEAAWGTVGGRISKSERTFLNRRLTMIEDTGAAGPVEYTAAPEVIFGPDKVGVLSRITETTRDIDSYEASQTLLVGYLQFDTPIVGPLSFAGGARMEAFSQRIASQSPFETDNTPERLAENATERSDLDVLPGASLKYELTPTMLLRAAYGMTLSRPQVRELAAYDYYDFLRDRTIQGDPNLKTATIHNVDLRWEWFFAEGQIAAVSGFYKKFKDPIELQILEPDTYASKYANVTGARSLGAELELRADLAPIARALRRFSVGGNLSLISSRLEIPRELAGAVRAERPLAGQAPYVMNLSLRFSDPGTAVAIGLVYNVVGPRISDVGTRKGAHILPDIIEQHFHSLDLVANWGMTKHLKLKLRARNLLLQKRVLTQGDLTVQELNPGVSGSIGLSYSY